MPKAAKKSKPRVRRVSRRKCNICTAHGSETFHFLRRRFVFDVDRAREIVADGRPTVELEPADVRFAVDTSRIHEHHVPHVNLRFPGIMARVRFRQPDGRVVEGDLLIDGHHRAARALQLRKPYQALLLTVDETDTVLIKRPDKVRRRRKAACKR